MCTQDKSLTARMVTMNPNEPDASDNSEDELERIETLHRTELISVGMPAPDFEASTDAGETVRLRSYRGRSSVVLVFYPADYTPACTTQLCGIRDHWTELQQFNAAAFGVNPLHARLHAMFSRTHRLPFPLIYDKGGEIAASYGCRGVLGVIIRSVYVIDMHGRVAWAMRGKPETERIITVLRTLHEGSKRV